MTLKKIPIGVENFKELIEENYYFVDKSLLIKEFIDNSARIILTPRPRRFGKSLNMSMLKYFFDIEEKESTKNIFDGLKIENEKNIMEHKNQYPVIYISFKSVKYNNFENALRSIEILMS